MNTFIYLVKFIASMGVIIGHTRFPGTFGFVWDAISRYICPFFFAISGRFLIPYSMRNTEDIRKRVGKAIRKLLKTTGVVYLIYLVYSLLFHLKNGIGFGEWFTSKFNLSEARWFFLFNSGKFIYDGSYTFDHLWYLFALFYVFGLIYIFAPVLRKWYKFLVVILLAGLYFGELLQTFYPIRPFDISITTWYVLRNWLFEGMPFVLIGIWFSDYIGKLKEDLSEDEYRIRSKKWIIPGFIGIIAGMVISSAEFLLLGKKECPFGALLMVLGILFLSETGIGGGKYLWKIGKEGSSNIYFYHVLVICLVDQLSYYGFLPDISMGLKPFVIMALCLLFIWFIPRTIKKYSCKKTKI